MADQLRVDLTTSYSTRDTDSTAMNNYLQHVADNVIFVGIAPITHTPSPGPSSDATTTSPDLGVESVMVEKDGTSFFGEVQLLEASPDTYSAEELFTVVQQLAWFAKTAYQASP